MSDQLLNILKYFLVALLWLFFVRVLSAVWAEVRRGGAVASTDSEASPGARREPPPRSRSADRQERAPRPPPPLPAPRTGAAQAVRAARPAMGTRFRVIEPSELEGRTFELGDEVTVGRAPGCGVQLGDDSFTSQIHARVYRRDGKIWVEDLGSTNGTYVNARKVTAPAPLHEGDRLKVGSTVLEVSP